MIQKNGNGFSEKDPAPIRALLTRSESGVAVFGNLHQAAVMPSHGINKANLIEMLTYCRARA
jgi:hypothetical protein